jgi:hypothetical protein
MMAKRANLAENVKAAAGASAATGEPIALAFQEPKRSMSRVGRKAIYAWVEPAEHLKLKRLAVDTGRSVEALVIEGVQLVFERHHV